MGWICGTDREEENWKRDFGGETRGKRSLRNLGAGGKNNINVDLKKVLEGFEWIHLARNRDQCCIV